jgi:hypothetical protein
MLTSSFELQSRPAPRHEPLVAPPASRAPAGARDNISDLVDRLVDAIDVRESCEPDVPHWEVGPRIRDLERDLAREWGAARWNAEPGSLVSRPRP